MAGITQAQKSLAALKRDNEKLLRKADSSILGDQILRLENTLAEKAAEAHKLIVENKTLRKIQRAHEKALVGDDESERLERDNKHVISENRALKKKLRDAKEKLEQMERSSDAKFKKINDLRQKLKQMKSAAGPARPSLIPSLCTRFTRAGIEWPRCHRAACMARPHKEPHHSGQAEP